MKIQDLGFLVIFVVLLFVKKDKFFIVAGLVSIALAIPLFSFWVFFTAERLTWYAAAFFLVAIMGKIFFEKEIV